MTEELETADDARAADPGLAHVTDVAFWKRYRPVIQSRTKAAATPILALSDMGSGCVG